MPTTPDQIASESLGYGDYVRFSKLLLDRYGLYFSERRRGELDNAVRKSFAASTCKDLTEYYTLLVDQSDGGLELERLINAATVNETYFFRDSAQFDALTQSVLPEIIERRRSLRTIRIWSAGCASGEEPYSIAMLLCHLLPDIQDWAITILGTDINTEALDRARQGIYGEWAFRETQAREWRPRYFHPHGPRWELDPQIRRMVTFNPLNLAESVYPTYTTNTMYLDLIICRNVTIYFNEQVTQTVVNHFYDALIDGGWLIVGHAELSLNVYRKFTPRNYLNAVFYQKPSSTPVQIPALTPPPVTLEPAKTEPPKTSLHQTAPLPASIPPPSLLEQARKYLEYGQSQKVKDLLLPALKQSGIDRAACYTLLGQACANLNQLEEAENWCQEAVKIDRLALEAYYTLGLVLQHQKRIDQAIEALKKVIYIDHNDILGHFTIARLYYERGMHSQALKALDNARRLLENRSDDSVVPRSGNVTVKRLRDAVTRQQQQWTAQSTKN